MGFVRQQEERLAARLLQWRYEKLKVPMPDAAELEERARQIVDEAHQIARQRGRNVVAIMRELAADLKKR
jgi:hypothetical protein